MGSDDEYIQARITGLRILLADLDDDPARREARMLELLTPLIQDGPEAVSRVVAVVGAHANAALTHLFGSRDAARQSLADDLAALMEREEP